jgi:transposase
MTLQADCPEWKRFLNSIFDNNQNIIEYIQRKSGYILTGVTREEDLDILYGIGGNGKSDNLEPDQIRVFEEKYDAITKIGFEENPPPLIPENQIKKAGRKRQSKSKNLLDRFAAYKTEILRFMNDFDVPFENNLAERDVRMMKVQQKISGTFRSNHGADMFCRIRGYISTVKKNKISVIDAIQDVLSGKAFIPNIAN